MKDGFIDQIINNVQLTWFFACTLRIKRTCNPMVGFSNFLFNKKLLDGVTCVTWTHHVYIYRHTYKCECGEFVFNTSAMN